MLNPRTLQAELLGAQNLRRREENERVADAAEKMSSNSRGCDLK
jgi:hypothetical protein